MKRLLCIFILLNAFQFIYSQDQIFKRDNSSIKAKIIEVNITEIKYKLFENLNGPTYIEDKKNVIMIIYENGKTEAISSSAPVQESESTENKTRLSKKDSMSYYGSSNNISINFLNFFNSEVGLIYTKEFFNSNFNIVIPMAVGLAIPYITESVWFRNENYQNNTYSGVDLLKKNYELGIGINYYPNLGTSFNYFIGPVFRFMQFDCKQIYGYSNNNYPSSTLPSTTKNSQLNRYSMTITNGITFRTKSRLTSTLFASLGFKNDQIIDPIVDPITNKEIQCIANPVSFNIWMGFNVGFNF